MNTIQITTTDGVVNYTESEVIRFIQKAKDADGVNKFSEDNLAKIRSNNNQVRDFFSEGQWDDGEFTASKEDINELLESIGANRLTTKYNATFTVTGTFSVNAEDPEEAEAMFTDNVSVDFYDGDIDVDQIEVLDMEEEY